MFDAELRNTLFKSNGYQLSIAKLGLFLVELLSGFRYVSGGRFN